MIQVQFSAKVIKTLAADTTDQAHIFGQIMAGAQAFLFTITLNIAKTFKSVIILAAKRPQTGIAFARNMKKNMGTMGVIFTKKTTYATQPQKSSKQKYA